MNRSVRQTSTQADPTPAGGWAETGATAGRTDGRPIDLGMGRRRVTGDDLFVFHALVSGNDQTFEDLSGLRPADAATAARLARQTRPAFVTEGWLDRVNDRLTGWLSGLANAVGEWVRGGPEDRPANDATAPAAPPRAAGSD
ncbi:MAG: hypothetical protein JWO31_1171, partial [Phycisphaerales bacterium]|nr:hypothetical protein [Phycisphaerales bacterium]